MTFLLKKLRSAAVESCAGCDAGRQMQPGTAQQEAMPEGFTYNDGGGQRDTVLLQGSLAEAMRQALQLKFESTGVANLHDAVDVDNTFEKVEQVEDNLGKKPATESQAQDAHVEKMLSELANTPGADVVLPHFNYEMVKQHVAKFADAGDSEGAKLRQQDIPGGVIPLYVSTMEELENVRMVKKAHDERLNILVIADETKPSLPGEGGFEKDAFVLVQNSDTTKAIDLTPNPQIKEDDVQMIPIFDRVAAIESAYKNSGSQIFFGLESFVANMAYRLQARQKAQ